MVTDDSKERLFIGAALAFFLTFTVIFATIKAHEEAKAFNRCNPGSNVTTWEAAWAEYRILDCSPEE
jgi:hypothetical protein